MKKQKSLTKVIEKSGKNVNVKVSKPSKSYLSKAAATCQTS